jgi:hypothetical protein
MHLMRQAKGPKETPTEVRQHRPSILRRTSPPSGSSSILDQNEQRSQSSPIDQISGTREGEGGEL